MGGPNKFAQGKKQNLDCFGTILSQLKSHEEKCLLPANHRLHKRNHSGNHLSPTKHTHFLLASSNNHFSTPQSRQLQLSPPKPSSKMHSSNSSNTSQSCLLIHKPPPSKHTMPTKPTAQNQTKETASTKEGHQKTQK